MKYFPLGTPFEFTAYTHWCRFFHKGRREQRFIDIIDKVHNASELMRLSVLGEKAVSDPKCMDGRCVARESSKNVDFWLG